jgi:MraZ protein
VSIILPDGTYDSTIDEKGRVIIPAPLREWYKEKLVVTQGNLKCVWVFLPEFWDEYRGNIEKGFREKIIDYRQYEFLKRVHIYPKRDAELDGTTGRIPIASAVRSYAGLINKKCLVIGTEKCLEIWDSQFYNEYLYRNDTPIQEAEIKIGSAYYGNAGGGSV